MSIKEISKRQLFAYLLPSRVFAPTNLSVHDPGQLGAKARAIRRKMSFTVTSILRRHRTITPRANATVWLAIMETTRSPFIAWETGSGLQTAVRIQSLVAHLDLQIVYSSILDCFLIVQRVLLEFNLSSSRSPKSILVLIGAGGTIF